MQTINDSILIIEDDKNIATVEADCLEINGFGVETTYTGDEGLRLALENDYDLILLDVMLPGADGFEICKKIRKEKETPILMVTARQDSADKILGLGLGADDYISKPFDPPELVARVRAHLSRYERLVGTKRPLDAENWMDFGRMKVGLHSYRVMVDEAEVRLTGKEFELLRFLVTNPNNVFSKETLFDRIWDLDALGDASTVAVHIKHIRDKIEIDPANPRYIQTVWGAGYRFCVA